MDEDDDRMSVANSSMSSIPDYADFQDKCLVCSSVSTIEEDEEDKGKRMKVLVSLKLGDLKNPFLPDFSKIDENDYCCLPCYEHIGKLWKHKQKMLITLQELEAKSKIGILKEKVRVTMSNFPSAALKTRTKMGYVEMTQSISLEEFNLSVNSDVPAVTGILNNDSQEEQMDNCEGISSEYPDIIYIDVDPDKDVGEKNSSNNNNVFAVPFFRKSFVPPKGFLSQTTSAVPTDEAKTLEKNTIIGNVENPPENANDTSPNVISTNSELQDKDVNENQIRNIENPLENTNDTSPNVISTNSKLHDKDFNENQISTSSKENPEETSSPKTQEQSKSPVNPVIIAETAEAAAKSFSDVEDLGRKSPQTSFKNDSFIDEDLQCGECDEFFSNNKLMTHILSKHNPNSNKKMKSPRQSVKLSSPLKRKINKVFHTCVICLATFDSPRKLSRHINSLHSWNCYFCSKILKNKPNLLGHMHVHTGEKLYKCENPRCQKEFGQKNNLDYHLRSGRCMTLRTSREKSKAPSITIAPTSAPDPIDPSKKKTFPLRPILVHRIDTTVLNKLHSDLNKFDEKKFHSILRIHCNKKSKRISARQSLKSFKYIL